MLATFRESLLSDVNVAIPAIVVKYNHTKQLANVKPLVRTKYKDDKIIQPPVITDVPVIWPRAGGAYLVLPMDVGDTVLLIFTDKNISTWLNSGGTVDAPDDRKHSLSDCVAIPGLCSFNQVKVSTAKDEAALCYNKSKIVIKQDGSIQADAPTGMVLNTPLLQVNGQIADSVGSMAAMRTAYSSDTHNGTATHSNSLGGP